MLEILEIIKLALRINSFAFDIEISQLIEACKIDLRLAGVNVIMDTDPLIQRAVILYVKANFGSNPDSEKYQKSYEMLKCSLAVAGDYNAYTITFTITGGGNPIEDASITFNGEIKKTNILGVAVFKNVQDGVNQKYTVIVNGYTDVNNYLDITASASIAVTML
jgi:hypothetical protein